MIHDGRGATKSATAVRNKAEKSMIGNRAAVLNSLIRVVRPAVLDLHMIIFVTILINNNWW